MKHLRLARFSLLLTLSITSLAWATDYRPDTNYPDFGLNFTDVVYDVFVHPDGRYLVAGEYAVADGGTAPFLRRYHANGTPDTSFNSALLRAGSSGGRNNVTRIYRMSPNGQYLIGGAFHAGTSASWTRLNANGSLDSSVPLNTVGANLRGVQDDGKLLFCGPRTENGVTYNILFRRNADLSFDPSFRITFADPVPCADVLVLPDGKMLVARGFTSGGQPLKQLHRLNSDGSLDQTFNADIATGSSVVLLAVLPDASVLITNSAVMKLLGPDGSQLMAVPTCNSSFAIPLGDGSFMATGCKKVASSPRTHPLARVLADGSVDQSMDYLEVLGYEGVKGFREDGTGGLYVYGGISIVNSFHRRGLVRVIPNTSPKKAQYDFDGDGKSDIAVYRPGNNVWYLNQSAAGFSYTQWGLQNDRPVVGDANGDGKADIGVFRNGAWHAYTSGGGIHYYMCLGAAGDLPLVGAKSEFGITRDQFVSRGLRSGAMRWFVRDGHVSCWMFPQQPFAESVTGELASDKPVIGDFNGDSIDEIGYFRDGYWYGVDEDGVAAPTSMQWGSAGDIPVPGDYDGDRQTDYAIFRPSTGEWWINRSTDGILAVAFGLNGDVPVPADYDGDGNMDIAIYRNGAWWKLQSSNGTVEVVNWGVAGDIPIPSQHQ